MHAVRADGKVTIRTLQSVGYCHLDHAHLSMLQTKTLRDESKTRREGLYDMGSVSLEAVESRLSFPATGPPDPGRVSEGFQKGSPKGFLKGL